MTTYVEQDCTITREGRSYEAGGAFVSETHLIAYPGKNGVLTDWHGTPIGSYTVSSSWYVNSYMSDLMYAMRARVDGKTYHGRSFGVGMVLRGKRVAAELKGGE